MPVSTNDILKNLQSGKYSPLYFLHGDEPFNIDLIAEYIEENGLTDAEKGFNLTVMYGKDVSVRQVLENARRFPMMAQRQVVIVKEAQEIQDLKKKAGQDSLVAYCKSPVPSTVLVFAHKHKKIDGRSELAKSLDKFAILAESKKIYDNQVPSWIKDYCKTKGFPVAEKAVLMLSEYIGNNLSRIAKEIDKVLIGLPAGTEITQEAVSKQVGISKEYNVFELQSALAKREVEKVYRIIKYFEADIRSNPIIPMIAMLYSYFSKILIMHHQKGKNPKEIAAMLKVNPYFIKEYQIATRNYPLRQTVRAIELLHEADLRSKGVHSSIPEAELMKELVNGIMSA